MASQNFLKKIQKRKKTFIKKATFENTKKCIS